MGLAAIRRKRDGKLAGLTHYLDYDDSYNINFDRPDVAVWCQPREVIEKYLSEVPDVYQYKYYAGNAIEPKWPSDLSLDEVEIVELAVKEN